MTDKDMNDCGCGCGHDHDHDHDHEVMELETMFLTFEDENGEDIEYELGVLDIFEHENKEYIALVLPADEDDEESQEEIFLYIYDEDEDGEPLLSVIEDEEEFDVVGAKFEERFFIDEE